jgi:hypothetical protein
MRADPLEIIKMSTAAGNTETFGFQVCAFSR